MPIMQFNCPSCQKLNVAYIDANISHKCSYCGIPISYQQSGMIDVVKEAKLKLNTKENASGTIKSREGLVYQDDATLSEIQSVKQVETTSIKEGTGSYHQPIWPFIAGVLIALVYFAWRDFIKPKLDSKPIVVNSQPVQIVQQPQVYQPSTLNPPRQEAQQPSATSSSDKGIIYVHIVNTFQGTDKTEKCNSVLDENSHTLSLTSKDHPANSFKLIYQDGGMCNFQFYSDNVLEVEKAVQRRSDLETGDGTLIYTSRTGEITIYLSY